MLLLVGVDWRGEFEELPLLIAGYEAVSCIVFSKCRARLCVLRHILDRLSWSSSIATVGGCCSIFLHLFAGLVVAGMHVPKAASVFLIVRLIEVRDGERTVCC
jgi:hypothetical protein